MDAKEKILQKSLELFKRFGIRSVTMDEIASQCGVSKKTVYQFFDDKYTLVENILTQMIAEAEIGCTLQQVKATNAVHEIFLSMEMVQQKMQGVNPALIHDLKKYHSKAYEKLEEHKQKFLYNFISNNHQRGIAEGLYRSDFKKDIAVMLHWHCVTLAFDSDLFLKMNHTFSDIDFEISLFMLYGLATAKGVKIIEKYKQQRSKLSIA